MHIFRKRMIGVRGPWLVAGGAFFIWSELNAAAPALPTPCSAGACGVTGPSRFVTSGAATAVATANALTVNQTTNSAILNWSSFNIGADGAVTFKQPSPSAIALNRIYQGSPSQIFGKLSANGQVYLVNLNGFVFGSTATVNVGSLLVSSLPLALSDANFGNGILSPLQNGAAVFDAALDPLATGGRASVLDVNGQPVLDALGKPLSVQVVVQPGAKLAAADQGRLLLAGQNVTNGGSLTAPDGQVILAAGSKVYIQADADPALRGLVVEVDQGGKAWNQLTGSLSADRGNVSMVGLAVNQDGRISATTSVNANGSIRLEAADTHAFGGSSGKLTVSSSHGGTLTIGPQSDLEILPELASKDTAVAAQAQLPSSVTLLGEQVFLQGGTITAPGGNLTAIAAANPSSAAADPTGGVAGGDATARLRIDSGTKIDLSGSQAALSVDANLVAVQLRTSELADDPTQRDGALHGQTVYIDARNAPSKAFADVSGEVAGIPLTVAQRTETGGNAVFQSEGDAVFASGASLNVSGGATTFAGGVMQTSFLVGANGHLYPIATADPLLTYLGVVNPTFSQSYNKWGVKDVLPTPGLSAYQPGYVQGAAAGSVQFAAPSLVLQGSLSGSAVNGPYQRTPATAVSGGRLTIGLPGGIGGANATPPIDFLAPAVRLTATPTPTVVGDDGALGPMTLDLPTAYLTNSGFTSTQIFSNYGVTLPANTPLVLPAGSTLAVEVARVDILSSITDPGGVLSFLNTFNVGSAATPSGAAASARPGVFVGSGVTLDVRGQFVNDALTPDVVSSTPTWQDGGKITLGLGSIGALLSLEDNVSLRTSGGASINNRGVVTAGKGGSITLNAGVLGGGLNTGANFAIDGFGVDGAAGGSFSLTAPRIDISNGTGNWSGSQRVDDTVAPGNVYQVRSSLFSDYGFETFNLTASGLVAAGAPTQNVFSVDTGTVIDTTVASLVLGPNPSLQSSAPTLDGIAAVAVLPPYLRPAASVSFSALPPAGSIAQATPLGTTLAGDLFIGKGASMTTDVGGSITLTGLDSIIIDGTLRAPGGSVSAQVLSPGSSPAYSSYESGLLADQRIELGPDGVIDVAGTFVAAPSATSLTLGTAYAGGKISLLADRGVVVTDPSSFMTLAGTTAVLDAPQADGSYAHESAATAGGSLTVHSGEAVSLLGNIAAAAGAGGSTGPAAAGSLDVAVTRSAGWWAVASVDANNTFSTAPLTVELLPTLAGLAPSLAASNRGVLGVAQLAQAGFDALRIEAGNVAEFSGAFTLDLARQIIIDAPVVSATGGVRASLNAPYLEVGYESLNRALNSNVASGGTGALTFAGGEIDLVGQTVFQGAADVRFQSTGDLVLRGQALGTGAATLVGGTTVAGRLELDAARIFPVSATSFALNATTAPGIAGAVVLGQTGANPGTPLSAGGAVSITAASITSTGTLYAPFGTISLNAGDTVALADGSLTSVSGGGLTIPYGETQFGGQQWIYDGFSGNTSVAGVPNRAVNLTAPHVAIAKQATIDLTGGGELAAFEWIPGSGGTRDALASGVTAGVYAVLPSLLGQAAPQDPSSATGSTILPGQSVYLSGGGGLAAGVYPLLPARYALEPGAFLIKVEPQLQSVTSGALGSLADGTPVVAGFFSFGASGLHQAPGYQGFAIYPGTYGRALAQYDVSLASTFFGAAATAAGSARPVLPADAGTLAINVQSRLDALGSVLTAAAPGGLAAALEISANDLVIGASSSPTPADAVSVSGSVLAAWHPGSLLLGGLSSMGGSSIDVLADTVTIGSGTSLTADQIIVVANQGIDVQNGAFLQSSSATTGKPVAVPPLVQPVTLTSAGGGAPALLALSDLNWLIPTRSSGVANNADAHVNVAAGGGIGSLGSLTLDAPGSVSLDGMASGVGAEWSLGSSSIAFVPSGSQADALSITPRLVAQLGAASAVRLASTGAIDLLTPVTLGVSGTGGPTLQSLTLSAASLNNLAGGGAASMSRFGAQSLLLEGSGADAGASVGGPAGSQLSFSAGTLEIGPAFMTVNGFATTRAVAAGNVLGQGVGGLNVGGDLSLASAGLTAESAAQTTINAGGLLALTAGGGAGAGANPVNVPVQLGGALLLSGATVDVAGAVRAPTGSIDIRSSGDLTLDAGATVSTSGTVVAIGNQSVGTAGGRVSLAAGGNLLQSAGATLDVSGAGDRAGGVLAVAAGGSVDLGGLLKGAGGTNALGGGFSLDALSLASPSGNPLDALNVLAGALGTGGFSNTIDLRVRTGDVTLGAAGSLTANSVSLTADTGRILIEGMVSAPSGAARGELSLFGGAGVELASGAVLRADGAGASGLGGKIEIGAGQLMADQAGVLDRYGSGSLSLDAGSTISAAGAAGMGSLLLRAPALIASNDIAITALAANTRTVGDIIIEPVLPFNTANFADASLPSGADLQQVQQAVGNYLALAGPAIAVRLAPPSGTPLMIEAGVEIIAPGSLILQSSDGLAAALDLSPSATGSNWRFRGAPVDLTIRAAGDLTVANSISDGFSTVSAGGVDQPALLPGPSSSIQLIAGADLASANPLATVAGGSGTLTLGSAATGSVAVVRTGTGDLDLMAAKDIVIATTGSGAYTAGTPAIAPGGSADTPYPDVPAALGTVRSDIDASTGLPYTYGILVPRSSLLLTFPTGGGDLHVRAGQDVIGAPLAESSVSIWQLREGGNTYNQPGGLTPAVPAEWGVNLAAYDWNFGTLGGGDLSVSAGRDAVNVTAAAAGSLLPQYGGKAAYVTSGGLVMTAGRDIGSAQVFLADGVGTVTGGGALSAVLPSLNAGDPNVGSAFYLQSSAINVTARLGIAVDGVFNPTALGQLGDPSRGVPNPIGGAYFSYGDASALNLQTASGDIAFGQASAGIQTLLGFNVQGATASFTGDVLPANLSAQALGGNITFGLGFGGSGTGALYPSAHGQLDLLAARDINGAQGLRLVMSDAAAGSYATVATPLGQTAVDAAAFAGAIHTGDAAPARITAGGSINNLSLSIPKAAVVTAGRDLLDVTYFGQNLGANDQTILNAGRDFTYSDAYAGAGVSVGGPGALDILTGRDLSLGFSQGVVTTGNLLNPNLPSAQGANLTMATGLGTTPDYADFLGKIIAPSSAYQAQLVTYVELLQGASGLSFPAAAAAFAGLSADQQRPLIDGVFFNELLVSGRAANSTPAVGFSQGYAAIDALFPASRSGEAGYLPAAYAGNLTLDFSRIYTLSGGNISLVIPGGSLDVGLANPPASLASRAPSTLGIVAEGSGNVSIYSRGDVDVNASRVFTLGGGNILIWSNEGSIDAGRGAKTAVSAPPPSVLINSDGTVSLDFAGAASGSGIRTIQTNPLVADGNVDLIAPVGTVNAGDAGIGAAGNINIAALSVIGLDNINFGGTSTGVPAQVSNIGASLSGASNAAASTSNTASDSAAGRAAEKEAAAPLAQNALSWLDVFVTGLGEENCKPDDIECLKRQKTPTR